MDVSLFTLVIFLIATYPLHKHRESQPSGMKLTTLVLGSICTVLLILVVLYAVGLMLGRNLSVGVKLWKCALAVGFLGFFIWLNVMSWKQWKREQAEKKE